MDVIAAQDAKQRITCDSASRVRRQIGKGKLGGNQGNMKGTETKSGEKTWCGVGAAAIGGRLRK